jgi:hypothetical protein
MSEKTSPRRLVPLRQAADELGVEDLARFLKTVKRLGCLVRVGAVTLVDMGQLMARLEDEAARQQEAKAKRATTQQSEAHKLGLCQARLKRAPQLIAKKEEAIREAEQILAASQNAYEKRRAQKKLEELQDGLARLRENQKRDEAERDRIMGAEQED